MFWGTATVAIFVLTIIVAIPITCIELMYSRKQKDFARVSTPIPLTTSAHNTTSGATPGTYSKELRMSDPSSYVACCSTQQQQKHPITQTASSPNVTVNMNAFAQEYSDQTRVVLPIYNNTIHVRIHYKFTWCI